MVNERGARLEMIELRAEALRVGVKIAEAARNSAMKGDEAGLVEKEIAELDRLDEVLGRIRGLAEGVIGEYERPGF